METNYTLKRLQLFWPVFALLMLSSFFVNAQSPLANESINPNAISIHGEVLDLLFCDVLTDTETVIGTKLKIAVTGPVPGPMIVTAEGDYNTASIDANWVYSLDDGVSWLVLPVGPSAVAGGTVVQTSPVAASAPFTLNNGVGNAAVPVTLTGYYDLSVSGFTQTIWFRRNVVLATDNIDIGGTSQTAATARFIRVDSELICEENEIWVGTNPPALNFYEFCENDLECVVINGSGFEEGVCEVEFQWWSKTPGALAWTPIDGATGVDYEACPTETTHFAREAGVGLVPGQFECLSASVTIIVHDVPDDLVIIGTQSICLDQDETNLSAVYDAVFTLPLGASYGDYTYNWFVLGPYGTFVGAGIQPNQAQVSWVQETPNATTAYVRVIVTEKATGCQVAYGPYYVDVSRQPVATIDVDDSPICLTYDAVNEQYVGVIQLEAEFTTAPVAKQGGTWSYVSGGMVEPIFMLSAPNPLAGTFTPAGSIDGETTVWAVIVIDEEDLDVECLDLDYTFNWEEFAAGSCVNDDVDVDIMFSLPHDEFMFADVDGPTPVCATSTVLEANTPWCYVGERDAPVGVWTATKGGVAAVGVTFSPNANDENATVTVSTYGTYVFTWTITDGICAAASASVEVTFLPTPLAVAEDIIEVCNNFNQNRTAVFTFLDANVPAVGETGAWKLISKPLGSNDPTFVDGNVTNPKAQIFVSSFGRYVFEWTVGNGTCSSTATSTVYFNPGIKDVSVTPATYEACSLYFAVTLNAKADWGVNMSKAATASGWYHKMMGEAVVMKWHPDNGWEEYTDWTLSNTLPAGWAISGATLTYSGKVETIAQALNFNMLEYGSFKIEWSSWIASDLDGLELYKNGNDGPTCSLDATANIYLYYLPIADIMDNDWDEQLCGLSTMKRYGAGTTAAPYYWMPEGNSVTLLGSNPFQITTGLTIEQINVGTVAAPKFIYEWQQDNGYKGSAYYGDWNRNRIAWSVQEETSPGVWTTLPASEVVTIVPNYYPTTNLSAGVKVVMVIPDTDNNSYRGKQMTAYALIQGEYRFVYTITNVAQGCTNVAWQDVAFLQEPEAGDHNPQEVCGFIDDRANECEGWNAITRFVADLSAVDTNTGLPTISGYWFIDASEIIVGDAVVGTVWPTKLPENPDGLIGYLPEFSGGTWTPSKWNASTQKYELHDWIKVDGVLAYTVNATTGNLVWALGAGVLSAEEAVEVEVSRHGVFPFEWIATNPIANPDNGGCEDDDADHTIYFKNTPLARDITPIKVISQGGSLYYGGLLYPFEDCYACDNNVTTFYLLERPIVEQKHGVAPDDLHELSGGFASTIPATQSVRWYTIDGGQQGAVINKPIQGGTIVRTYAVEYAPSTIGAPNAGTWHKLVHTAPLLNFNKHFIVEIKWDNEPLGVIIYEEENTRTECVVTNEFVINKVSPQVIAGPTPVPAFTDEANGNDHIYTLLPGAQDEALPIPGAVYEWEVDGNTGSIILGGYYPHATTGIDTWIANTNVDKTEMSGYGLYKIHVYWAAGHPGDVHHTQAHGFVKANIDGYCHTAIAPYLVIINENTLVGQLKYWNQEETFMPTPFKLHPNNIPDYFYVQLWESVSVNIGTQQAPIWREQLTPIEKTRVIANTDMNSPYFGQPAFFEFKSLDLTKTYRLQVWDGGFDYLDIPLDPNSGQNYLSFTYTWNGWDGLGVTATDALAVIRMSAGLIDLNDPAQNNFWWVGSLDDDGIDYGFLSNAMANVNSDAAINIVDVRQLLFRIVGTLAQFANNTPNFRVAARFVDAIPQTTFGDGSEVTGFSIENDDDVDFTFIRSNVGLIRNSNASVYLTDLTTPNVLYEGTTNPNHLYYVSDKIDMTENANFINIYYAAVGDINSRNSTPVGGGVVKSASSALEYVGVMEAKTGELVTIPVRVSQAAEIGAVTIGLKYDSKLIEIVETDYEFAKIDNVNGMLRVAQVDVNGRVYGANETILKVTARILGDVEAAQLFTLDNITELADPSAFVLDVNLNTDAVSSRNVTNVAEKGLGVLSIGNYPNPFNSKTTIEYTLPEAGKVSLVVYNNVGQVVANLVNEVQDAGIQTVELTSADLGNGDGMFIYRIVVEGQSKTYTGTGNLMLVK